MLKWNDGSLLVSKDLHFVSINLGLAVFECQIFRETTTNPDCQIWVKYSYLSRLKLYK